MSDAVQLPFNFGIRPALEAEDFLVTPANAEAVAWIDRWPDWPGPLLVVWGPEGAGKSHLAQVFLKRTNGKVLKTHGMIETAAQDLATNPSNTQNHSTVLDDFDEKTRSSVEEEALFHLFNAAKAGAAHILVLARRAPTHWPINLPDLRSRLLASAVAEITEPDDSLLESLIVKHFSDRQLKVGTDVVRFIVRRMDRSFRAAAALVAAVDVAALAQQRAITVPLVREVLGSVEPSNIDPKI